VPLKLDVLKKT